jgi:hypothetical protein
VFGVGAGVAFVRRTNEPGQGLQSLVGASTDLILLPAGPTRDAALVGSAERERRKGEVPAHQGLKPLATNARPPGEEHAPIRTAHVRVHPQTRNTYDAGRYEDSWRGAVERTTIAAPTHPHAGSRIVSSRAVRATCRDSVLCGTGFRPVFRVARRFDSPTAEAVGHPRAVLVYRR